MLDTNLQQWLESTPQKSVKTEAHTSLVGMVAPSAVKTARPSSCMSTVTTETSSCMYACDIFLDAAHLAHAVFFSAYIDCKFFGEVKFKEMPQAEELLEQLRFINQVGHRSDGIFQQFMDSPWPGASNHSSRRQEQQKAPGLLGLLLCWGFLWDSWDSKKLRSKFLGIKPLLLSSVSLKYHSYCYCYYYQYLQYYFHYYWLLYSGMSRRDRKKCILPIF